MNKELAKLLAEAESNTIKELKDTNVRLLKQLERAKDKKADLIEAVYSAAKDGISTLDLPTLKAPPKSKKEIQR